MHFPRVTIYASRSRSSWLASFGLVCLTLATGCTKPALTQEVIDSYDLDERTIGHVQLYTSETIVLLQEETRRECEGGAGVHLTQNILTRRVVIKKGTPGRALRFEGDHILVGFVPNRPEFSLWFSRKHDRGDVAIEHEEFRLSHIDNPYDPNAPVPEKKKVHQGCGDEEEPSVALESKSEASTSIRFKAKATVDAEVKASSEVSTGHDGEGAANEDSAGEADRQALEEAQAPKEKAPTPAVAEKRMVRFQAHYPNSRMVRYNKGNYRPEDPAMWNAYLVYDGEALNERDVVERPEGWLVTDDSPKKKKKASISVEGFGSTTSAK